MSKCHLCNFFWSRQDVGLAACVLDMSIDELLDRYFMDATMNRPLFMLLPGVTCPFLDTSDFTCKAGENAPLYCLSKIYLPSGDMP